jgi:glycosyltransferase involved in cell wall biosynthesis
MFINYVSASPSFSGLGRNAFDMYRMFNPNANIYNFTIYRGEKTEPDDNTWIQPKFRHPSLNLFLPYLSYNKIVSKIKSSDAIIHIASPIFPTLFEGSNVIITIHDLIPFLDKPEIWNGEYRSLWNYYMRRHIKLYSKYPNIVTTTNVVKNELINLLNVDDDKVTVIPYAVSDTFQNFEDKNAIREQLNLPLDKKLILSISSSEKRKNLDMVSTTMSKLGNDYQLVRVGKGINNSITFQNVKDQILLNKIYNACDVLYFPTLAEGFGYPNIEAFKVGIPVVTSNLEVIKEVCGDAAIYIDPNDVKSNVEGINQAIANSQGWINKGFKRALLYSTDAIKSKLMTYYNNVM